MSTRYRFINLIIFLLSAFVILPIGFFGHVNAGLDPSWQFSLHMAFENNLIFGKDYIFTYGPLGFLSTRLPFASTKPLLIISDIFLWSVFFYCIYQALRRTDNIYQKWLIPLALLVMGNVFYFMDLVIVQFILCNFLLFLYVEKPSKAYLIIAG